MAGWKPRRPFAPSVALQEHREVVRTRKFFASAKVPESLNLHNDRGVWRLLHKPSESGHERFHAFDFHGSNPVLCDSSTHDRAGQHEFVAQRESSAARVQISEEPWKREMKGIDDEGWLDRRPGPARLRGFGGRTRRHGNTSARASNT